MSRKIACIVVMIMIPFVLLQAQRIELFQPGDSTAWHVYTSKAGTGHDPLKVFQFEGNTIHVSGEDFAYLITERKFATFHLAFEFKWGEKKYPPRENAKRDAGVLYHVNIYSGDKIWPRSLEYQIQEGDCGDFWMTDSTTVIYNDSVTTSSRAFNVKKIKDAEKPNGEWNKAEVIVKDGKITHLLNGQIVNSARLGNTSTGNVVLQSEGAELYYRNIEVKVLR